MKSYITKEEKEIIEKLKQCLGYDVPTIAQDRFDNLIDYIMEYEKEYNPKELIWRLCGCFHEQNIKFNRVIDIFVNSKDCYYTSELVSYVGENLDQKYLVNKMIGTNDLDYIKKSISNSGDAMKYFLEPKYMEKLNNFLSNR